MNFRLADVLCAAAIAALPSAAGAAEKPGEYSRPSVSMSTMLSQSILQSGKRQRVFLKIGLRGSHREPAEDRTPANIALVIDRSGSMRGTKIAKAREAAMMAIDRLGGRDHASIVIFDNRIDTLVETRRVSDRAYFHDRIAEIEARGSTAIYAAVEQAAREIRRKAGPGRLNRIILLSDGLANVGPTHPRDFEALGQRLGSEGISISTIGLGSGYNEDLMAQMAAASDGNHAFARNAADLAKIFNQEFDEVLSVSGQDIEIIIRTRAGVKPLRTLGRKADIDGNRVRIGLKEVYGTAENALLIELEVEPGVTANIADLADIELSYRSPDGKQRNQSAKVTARFSASAEAARTSIDARVMERILELQARERSKQAVILHDKGRVQEARKILRDNAAELKEGQQRYGIDSDRLNRIITNSREAAAAAPKPGQWNASRKQLREDQNNRQGSAVKY